ncbi:MAG: hypothetical protein COT14_03360 [Candidatus Diapherotrites archaeon CG08_land_8_20_14_0_20_30_16]|nr:MAG: hypothetical protein COT14_03360 [Candidatus Diapherotrites archaeon CG08_land_8_20_14_0_20_30_16]
MNAEIYQSLKDLSQNKIYSELTEPTIKRICEFAKTKEDAKVIAQFIVHILPRNMSLDSAIRIALYNLEFFKHFDIQETLSERFQIRRAEGDWWMHHESPVQFEIVDTEMRIATFSFYVVPTEKGLEIHINSLQGSKYEYPTMTQQLRSTKDDLKELTEFLKINWRIHIVKLLQKRFANENVLIIGDLPKAFRYDPGEKYILMLRQYLQTFLQAGIPIEQIDTPNIHKKFKEWVRQNLRLKRKREQGIKPQHQDKPKRVKLERKPGTRRPMA